MVRRGGVEPPHLYGTRPSTWRVYQFRHQRIVTTFCKGWRTSVITIRPPQQALNRRGSRCCPELSHRCTRPRIAPRLGWQATVITIRPPRQAVTPSQERVPSHALPPNLHNINTKTRWNRTNVLSPTKGMFSPEELPPGLPPHLRRVWFVAVAESGPRIPVSTSIPYQAHATAT